MAITLVQKNGSASTGTLNAAPPAWSVTPTVGNLLLIVGCEVQNTAGTWPTTPTGYTAFASTPFNFYSGGIEGTHGMYWKIATAGEATPGHYGETTGTQDWVTYTYEFANSGGGWIAAAADREVHSAASSTAGTSKASGSTAALSQANELAFVLCATEVAVTALTFTAGFTVDRPTTANGKLWCGWQATAATTALSTTASWTTAARAGVKIATFKAAASGTVYAQGVSGALSFAGAAPVKASARRLPSSMAFAGARTSAPTGRLVSAAFTPTGSLGRTLSLARLLDAAALSFSGSVTSASMYARSLTTAALSFVGSQSRIKSVSKSVSGALSFAGSSSRIASKLHSAVFAPTGSDAEKQTLGRSVAGVLTFSGAVSRRTTRLLPAALRNVGIVVTSQASNHFSAVFRPVAAAVTHGLPARTLFAGFQATSSLVRFTSRQLVASLIATGLVNTRYLPPAPVTPPGGGGFGAVMHGSFFTRYDVDAKWRHMKRVRVKS